MIPLNKYSPKFTNNLPIINIKHPVTNEEYTVVDIKNIFKFNKYNNTNGTYYFIQLSNKYILTDNNFVIIDDLNLFNIILKCNSCRVLAVLDYMLIINTNNCNIILDFKNKTLQEDTEYSVKLNGKNIHVFNNIMVLIKQDTIVVKYDYINYPLKYIRMNNYKFLCLHNNLIYLYTAENIEIFDTQNLILNKLHTIPYKIKDVSSAVVCGSQLVIFIESKFYIILDLPIDYSI